MKRKLVRTMSLDTPKFDVNINNDENTVNDDKHSEEDDCIINEPDISVITVHAEDSLIEISDSIIVQSENVEEENLMKIVFKDTKTYSFLKDVVTKFLKQALVSIDKHCKFNENQIDGTISIRETDNVSDDDSLFVLDTQPQNVRISSTDIPKYNNAKTILTHEKPKKKIENIRGARSIRLCFNCGGEHNLTDCRKARDHNKINQAKKNFNLKNERYHQGSDQKFGHFLPGRISENLEKALGLRHYEIPMHIYKMRSLGYPPGWLEDAKVSHSGLTLIDALGKENEGGEQTNICYDLKKIINFPGYNTKTKSSVYDDHNRYGAPPMLPEHSREAFIKSLQDKKLNYKKTKFEILPEKIVEEETIILTETDMEIDDEEEEGEIIDENLSPPGIDDTIIVLPGSNEDILTPQKAANDDSILDIMKQTPVEKNEDENCLEKERSISPTLLDLTNKQKQLMKDLQLDTTNISTSVDDSLIDEIMELEANNTTNNEVSITTCETPISDEANNTTNNDISITCETTASEISVKNRGTSLSSENGTPIFKFSPFSKLPSGDAFSVGVCDVINFENLADSIGTYDKMRKVLSKVRTKLIKLNNEDN